MRLLDRILQDAKSRSRIKLIDDHVDPLPEFRPLMLEHQYFRIVVCEVFIKNMPLFLKGFLPVIYARMGFEFGPRRELVSCVIDPTSETFANYAGAMILNQHLMKPVPFIDYNIDFSVSMFRVKVADNISTVIKILSSLASTVLPSVQVAAKVADTINTGLDSILFSKEAFVVGLTESFDETNLLTPGYYLLTASTGIDPSSLWVKEGRLRFGPRQDISNPFTQDDFILYRIDSLSKRSDFRSVEPMDTLYADALKYVRAGNASSLTDAYQNLLRAVSGSPEFTLPDIERITVHFGKELQQRWEKQKQKPGISFKDAEEEEEEIELPDVEESEYRAAWNWVPPPL